MLGHVDKNSATIFPVSVRFHQLKCINIDNIFSFQTLVLSLNHDNNTTYTLLIFQSQKLKY